MNDMTQGSGNSEDDHREVDESFSTWLVRRMKAGGITCDDLARTCEVTQATVRKWCVGGHIPDEEQYEGIAEAIGGASEEVGKAVERNGLWMNGIGIGLPRGGGSVSATTYEFARVLDASLVKAGTNYNRLSKMSGISRSFMSNLRVGSRNPVPHVPILARALNLPAGSDEYRRLFAAAEASQVSHASGILLILLSRLPSSEVADLVCRLQGDEGILPSPHPEPANLDGVQPEGHEA